MSEAFPDKDEAKRRILFVPCNDKKALHNWIKVFLNLDFPDCIVDPDSNSSPMDMIFEAYQHARKNDDPSYSRVLYYASRDSYKTLGASILEVLSVLHLQRSVAHMAAIEQQAKKAQNYVKDFFNKPLLRDFKVGDNARELWVVRYYDAVTGDNLTEKQYQELAEPERLKYKEIKHYIHIILCTMASTNSEHVPMFVVDEVDVVTNPKAYEEAKMIPAPRDGNMPITLLTSTRKFSFGLVQKEIDGAKTTKLQIRHWNLIDVTERCPATRHRPDLPHLPIYRSDETLRALPEAEHALLSPDEQAKYVKDEGYHGCLNNCSLFAMCRGRLADKQMGKSKLLRPIEHTINLFGQVSLPTAKAQLLCRKPSTEGLIFPNFAREVHMLTPAQIAEKVTGEPQRQGMTKSELIQLLLQQEVRWYVGMDFGFTHNFSFVLAAVDGNRAFVIDCQSQPELEPNQQIDLCDSKIKSFAPDVYADTENPQMIKTLRKHGYKMRAWQKLKGSVIAGIEIVRLKLMPAIGEPQLFFLEGDDGCELLAQRLSTYHWKLDAAGKPTDVPDDTDDDECDALRYLIMNVFASRGRVIATRNESTTSIAAESLPHGQYTQAEWMQRIIQERTGNSDPEPTETGVSKGRKGGFVYDIG